MALAFSEDLLKTLEGTVFHDSIQAALAKVRAGLGPELTGYLERLGDGFRVLPGPHKRYAAYRETIRTLNGGVLESHTLEMRYRTGRTGEESTRKIDPYKVWYHGGALYVIGHDHRSSEIRTFAVDTEFLQSTTVLRALRSTRTSILIRIRLRVSASSQSPQFRSKFASARTGLPTSKSANGTQVNPPRPCPAADSSSQCRLAGSQELANWVLSFGGGAEVVEPHALREEVRASLKAALSRYED